MLLVVLGAGASWDSVPENAIPQDAKPFRPPLAKDLFDNRSLFGEVLLRFSEATPIAMELQRRLASRDGATLEKELERFQEQAEKSYPPRKRQLTAVRFYLQQVLWQCSIGWRELNYAKTNYVDFFARIDRWRYAEGERVALATFNYDTIVDAAFSDVFGRPLTKPAEYMDDALALFKLHGSVNWGRVVQEEPRFTMASPLGSASAAREADYLRKQLISDSAKLRLSEDIVVMDRHLTPVLDGRRLYPALAIPFARKASFECPHRHLREFSRALADVNRIIVVGWRGNELHFLELLRRVAPTTPVQIVGLDDDGIWETYKYLQLADVGNGECDRVIGGFSRYLATDKLEQFLTRT